MIAKKSEPVIAGTMLVHGEPDYRWPCRSWMAWMGQHRWATQSGVYVCVMCSARCLMVTTAGRASHG